MGHLTPRWRSSSRPRLVHDDLIDNSDTRRGRPAAHRALEASHRAAGWSGDAEAFGRASAILLGDLLVAWSDDLLESALEVAAAGTHRAFPSTPGCERGRHHHGQFLDIAEESAWSVNDGGLHAERGSGVWHHSSPPGTASSSRWSSEEPSAGPDADQMAALRRFGHPVGMAFQAPGRRARRVRRRIRHGETGRRRSAREGKRTVLMRPHSADRSTVPRAISWTRCSETRN